MFKYIVCIFLYMAISRPVNAQVKAESDLYQIQVDKPFPNYHFNEIAYFEKSNAYVSDFKGKWLILDFWSQNCTSCIKEFPEINRLQNKYRQTTQFISVGVAHRNSQNSSKDLFEKLRSKNKLNLCVAWDTSLYDKLQGSGVPLIIIINPMGVVKGVTYNLTEENLIQLFLNQPLSFNRYYFSYEGNPAKTYNDNLPFLTNAAKANGGEADTAFVFRSLLSKWKPGMAVRTKFADIFIENGRFELIGVTLKQLYKISFMGNMFDKRWDDSLYGWFSSHLILNLRDSSLFNSNFEQGRNIFCYSITLPLNKTKADFQAKMQRDLADCFGYSVIIQKKQMPYYSLIATDKSKVKLATKGGEPLDEPNGRSGLTIRNNNIKVLIKYLSTIKPEGPPIVDETNIDSKVDITIKGLMTDLEDVKRALEHYDLKIIESKREMEVITITDGNNSGNK